jgi:vacuolar-type H+-ATPase subunit I/STV1
MGEQMKRILLFISLALLCIGLYLKFLYDVPDEQETINYFVSWFLIIIGISSIIINQLWNKKNQSVDENRDG